jgi:hypothetical protein
MREDLKKLYVEENGPRDFAKKPARRWIASGLYTPSDPSWHMERGARPLAEWMQVRDEREALGVFLYSGAAFAGACRDLMVRTWTMWRSPVSEVESALVDFSRWAFRNGEIDWTLSDLPVDRVRLQFLADRPIAQRLKIAAAARDQTLSEFLLGAVEAGLATLPAVSPKPPAPETAEVGAAPRSPADDFTFPTGLQGTAVFPKGKRN